VNEWASGRASALVWYLERHPQEVECAQITIDWARELERQYICDQLLGRAWRCISTILGRREEALLLFNNVERLLCPRELCYDRVHSPCQYTGARELAIEPSPRGRRFHHTLCGIGLSGSQARELAETQKRLLAAGAELLGHCRLPQACTSQIKALAFDGMQPQVLHVALQEGIDVISKLGRLR